MTSRILVGHVLDQLTDRAADRRGNRIPTGAAGQRPVEPVMTTDQRRTREGRAFSELTHLLRDTSRPIGERISTADAILDRALEVSRQLRMQLTADYARYLHTTPGALDEHNAFRDKERRDDRCHEE